MINGLGKGFVINNFDHSFRNAGVRGSNPLSGTITLSLGKSRLLLDVRKRGRTRGYSVGDLSIEVQMQVVRPPAIHFSKTTNF
jgi:hypothetical protein